MIVAIFGPTGSGKTDIAVHVARLLGTEVVNCDPAQCYRGFPILTNQPNPTHDAIAPHRMVGVWPLSYEATVAAFARDVHAELDELIDSHGVAVACSGSGLYLRAALTELAWGETSEDATVRTSIDARYEDVGGRVLHAELAEADPDVAARIHPNDRVRIVRALEAVAAGGSIAPEGGSIWDASYRRPTLAFGLHVDRALVRTNIDQRTASMFEQGVLKEVASVCGPDGADSSQLSSTSSKLHGLDDCRRVLAGELTRDAGIDLMATRTRQYAKRQDTWARRWPGLQPVEVDLTAFDGEAIAIGLAHEVREMARHR
jgi:tRNA dimethylallyltransferase